MRSIIKIYYTLSLIVTCVISLNAQQLPHYSHYMLNYQMYNPAVIGTNDYFTARFNNRNQWTGISGAPRTYTLSFFGPHRTLNMGYGGHVLNDLTGPESKTGIYGTYAYNVQLKKDMRLSLGINIGALNYKLDGTLLNLHDEGDPSLPDEILKNLVIDGSSGLYFYTPKYYAGFSAAQLFNSKVSISDVEQLGINKLKNHFYFSAGYLFDINYDFDLQSSILIKDMAPAPFQIEAGGIIRYRKNIWLGVSYRTNDAVSFLLGYDYQDKIYFGYSYDYTVTDISSVCGTTHELMIGLKFNKFKEHTRDSMLVIDKKNIIKGMPDSLMAFKYYDTYKYKKAAKLFKKLYDRKKTEKYTLYYIRSLIKQGKTEKAKNVILNENDTSLISKVNNFSEYRDEVVRSAINPDSSLAMDHFMNKKYRDASVLFEGLYYNTKSSYYLRYYLKCLKALGEEEIAKQTISREMKYGDEEFIVNSVSDIKESEQDDIIPYDKEKKKSSNDLIKRIESKGSDIEDKLINDLLLHTDSNDQLTIWYKHNLFEAGEPLSIKSSIYYGILRSIFTKALNKEINVYDYFAKDTSSVVDIEQLHDLFSGNEITDSSGVESQEQEQITDNKQLSVILDNYCNNVKNLFFIEDWYFNEKQFIFEKKVKSLGPVFSYNRETLLSDEEDLEILPFVAYFDNKAFSVPARLANSIYEARDMIILKDVRYEFDLRRYPDFTHRDSTDSEVMKNIKDWYLYNDWFKDFNRDRLVDIILKKVFSGAIPAYDPETDDKLSIREIKRRCGNVVDTVWVSDDNSRIKKMHLVKKPINTKEIRSIMFYEDWYFDNEKVGLKKKVKAIALVRYYTDINNKGEEILKREVVFKIYLK